MFFKRKMLVQRGNYERDGVHVDIKIFILSSVAFASATREDLGRCRRKNKDAADPRRVVGFAKISKRGKINMRR